jgi:hypothetical protein
MADVDDINVCPKCLHPVELLIACPDCKEPVGKMPSLLLQTLRILRTKGWVVESWERNGIDGPDFRLKLTFFMFAPPSHGEGDTLLLQGIAKIGIELQNLKPSILAFGSSFLRAARNLYEWTVGVPCFALPFGQDLCDLCRQQAGDWYFSRCVCPERWSSPIRDDKLVQFARGIPEWCIYADAQVVTKEVRLKQLEPFFQRNPIARRKLRKEFCLKDSLICGV